MIDFIKIEEARKKQCPFISGRKFPTETTCNGDLCMKWENMQPTYHVDQYGMTKQVDDGAGRGRCGVK